MPDQPNPPSVVRLLSTCGGCARMDSVVFAVAIVEMLTAFVGAVDIVKGNFLAVFNVFLAVSLGAVLFVGANDRSARHLKIYLLCDSVRACAFLVAGAAFLTVYHEPVAVYAVGNHLSCARQGFKCFGLAWPSGSHIYVTMIRSVGTRGLAGACFFLSLAFWTTFAIAREFLKEVREEERRKQEEEAAKEMMQPPREIGGK